MNLKSKYKGAIKLAAIGDALGWITEFESSLESLKRKYGTDYISDFYDWEKNVGGRFYGYKDYLVKGSYSDDTQLMLSVARSIQHDGLVNNEYFSKTELPSWLLYARGAGRTIKNAALKIQRKSAKWNNNFFDYKVGNKVIDYRDSGANGAAMRILPIALANFKKVSKLKENIFANSIVTHGHPRAIVGALLYGYAIDTILSFCPTEFTYKLFLTKLGRDLHGKLSIPFIKKKEFKSWERKWNDHAEVPFQTLYNLVLDEAQESLRKVYISLVNTADDESTIRSLGCYNPETKGSGISTVIAGIYLCCKYHQDPIKGIKQAANFLGTDTDSIAAFTGGLIGSLHGELIIPDNLKLIQDSDYLERTAIRLFEISEGREGTVSMISRSKCYKQLNNISTDDFCKGELVSLDALGTGEVTYIERQDTLTRGKYNLIVDVKFDLGQSCRFAYRLDKMKFQDSNLKLNRKTNRYNEPSLSDFIKEGSKLKHKIELFSKGLTEEQQRELEEILSMMLENNNYELGSPKE